MHIHGMRVLAWVVVLAVGFGVLETPAARVDADGGTKFKLTWGSMTGLLPRRYRSLSHGPLVSPPDAPPIEAASDSSELDSESENESSESDSELDSDSSESEKDEERGGVPVDWDFNRNTGLAEHTCPGQSFMAIQHEEERVTSVWQSCYPILRTDNNPLAQALLVHLGIRLEHCIFWFRTMGDPEMKYAVDMTPLLFFGKAYDKSPAGNAIWDRIVEGREAELDSIPHVRCITEEFAVKAGTLGEEVIPDTTPEQDVTDMFIYAADLHQYAIDYVTRNRVYDQFMSDCQSFTAAIWRHFTGHDDEDGEGPLEVSLVRREQGLNDIPVQALPYAKKVVEENMKNPAPLLAMIDKHMEMANAV